MTPDFILLLVCGAVAGGFINGLAGFGTALFALGFWLQIMPAPQAVAIVVIVSTLSGLQGVWIVRTDIRARMGRLLLFLLPAVISVPLGVELLSWIDSRTLKVTIAAFMLLFGGFFTVRRTLPKFTRPTPVLDAGVGFLGGVLGGAASLSGALPTMWCAMRPWSKQETRAVLQPFNVIILCLTAILLALRGEYTPHTLLFLAVALPVTMLSAQLGIYVFKRLSDLQFRRLLIAMMFLSGALLMLRELF
ncbi:sulfite exporter TauE/SafE family protein [Celeribacter halophilus]|uniref:sulfite exporter TauE/SafE family protein n=1 Tax=Celeribacter halophilus TaxID=576117 RepID=UPI0026E481CA|nr:sulfite exporter TauE/SafE family protein [Celeribacter halophilus]MDO6723340.1 sulfite exporter TauE/SafE family protein [Celeribacter halophilus]